MTAEQSSPVISPSVQQPAADREPVACCGERPHAISAPLAGIAWRPRLIVSIGLAAVTLAIFARSLPHEFLVYDDNLYVIHNDRVKGGLSLDNLSWATTAIVGANWHPLTVVSHMLDCELFGLDARGHRAVNLMLHAANTVLLFLVLSGMTGTIWPSALVAALFGWHPLHVESVVWIAERKDVLSTFFWLLAMVAYWRYVQRPSWPRYAWVAVAMALGLLSKPMVVTLPCVLLLLDWWPLERLQRGGRWLWGQLSSVTWRRGGQLALEKLPLLALSAVASAATVWAQRQETALATLHQVPFLAFRLPNAIVSYVTYVEKLVWPAGLAPQYPMEPDSLAWPRVTWCAASLLVVTGLALGFARRRGYLAVGWLWFLGTLVPVIGLVQVGGQARADRYMYIPLIGLAIVAAWGAVELSGRWPTIRRPLAAAAVVWLAILAIVTWRQIGFWKDTPTLFRRSIAVTSANYLAQYHLGNGLMNQYAELSPQERLDNEHLLEQAIAAYARSAEINATFKTLHYNLGYALRFHDDFEGAAHHFARAIQLGQDGAEMRFNLGESLWHLGRFEEAGAQFAKALEFDPTSSRAALNLAATYARLGRTAEAWDVYVRAVERNPGSPWVAERLARLYATCEDAAFRNPPAAVELAERACRLSNFRHPRLLDTLAAAHAAVGQYDAAIKWSTEAMAMVRHLQDNPDETALSAAQLDALDRGIAARIRRYQQRRPVYEPAPQEIDL